MSCHCHEDEHKHKEEHTHGHNHSHEKPCGCCHEEGEDSSIKKLIIRCVITAVLTIAALLIEKEIIFQNLLSPWKETVRLSLFIAAYLFIGYDVLLRSVKNILHGEIFDENFLMAVASIGAICIGETLEAVGVMLFYQIGEALQDYAADKSRDSITELLDIRPDSARKLEGTVETVGDVILVKPGEKIPLDGSIIQGESSVDTSSVTGESALTDVKAGDAVYSGTVNKSGLIQIKVEKPFAESTSVRILEMVEHAQEKKARTQNFITKFAKIYTPVVCAVALLLAIVPPLCFNEAWSQWIYRALIFLVVSCPCALIISVPLGFFAGLGALSKNGILAKGANYLELLANAKIAVFDKTGTLTKGTFEVTLIHPEENISEETLIAIAAHAEMYSTHPVAQSLVRSHLPPCEHGSQCTECKRELLDCCKNVHLENVIEIAGKGVSASVDGKKVLAGNDVLMKTENVSGFEESKNCEKCSDASGTVIHVAVDGKYYGHIVISDQVKAESKAALQGLKKLGVEKNIMLTGDTEKTAALIAKDTGIDEYYAHLLPCDKVTKLEQIMESYQKGSGKKGSVLFTGDGLNDAPVLTRADVGIAMGAMGTDAAIEAADVVIMQDELSKLPLAVKSSRKTLRIVKENIAFSIAVKIAVLILSALGLSSMWLAVFADVGVCLLAILNSLRALRV